MITYEYDQNTLAKVEKKLGSLKSEAPKALKNAINQTAKQARKDLATEAQKTYALKTGGFNKSMKIKGASTANLEAVIKTKGEHLSIKKNFSATGGKSGSVLKVLINKKRGRKSFDNKAFINNIARKGQKRKKDTQKGKAGSVVRHLAAAYREGPKRLHIHELYSVSIPQMIGNEKDVYGVVQPTIKENLQENVDKQVRKILEA